MPAWKCVGQASTISSGRESLAVGEVWHCNGVFQLALAVLPVHGRVSLSLGYYAGTGERDLTAIITGKHDSYEYKIGNVILRERSATAVIDAWPTHPQDDFIVVF
jgi:hypothetical protein